MASYSIDIAYCAAATSKEPELQILVSSIGERAMWDCEMPETIEKDKADHGRWAKEEVFY